MHTELNTRTSDYTVTPYIRNINMQLKQGTQLKHGDYIIESILGQGGFGITYLGIQTSLNRKVAIKEFFMKDLCNRDTETSHISVPSVGSKELVNKFKLKFIKEAQTIATLNHPNIVNIYDVFEENGTAYYVMEYHNQGSLADLVKQHGQLSEADALYYVRQVADALAYLHARQMNHLDVKPTNILLNENGHAVLIDFGLSKRYDTEGKQTSTTPIGISHGYAPLEQYRQGGVSTFSPATDIYSLGATLYKILTGQTPPDANDVNDEGLPPLPTTLSSDTKYAIEQAMEPRRSERISSISLFLQLLDGTAPGSGTEDSEETLIDFSTKTKVPKGTQTTHPPKNDTATHRTTKRHTWLYLALIGFVAVAVVAGLGMLKGDDTPDPPFTDTLLVSTPTIDSVATNATPQRTPPPAIQETPTQLFVTTQPIGATVYVDGKQVGKTPIEEVEIAKGKHTIKISLKGYETLELKKTADNTPIVINEVLKEIPTATPTQTVAVTSSNTSSTTATPATSTPTKATSTVPAKTSSSGKTYAQFFPFHGILLGKTTYADIEAMGYKVEGNHVYIRELSLWDDNEDKIFERICFLSGGIRKMTHWYLPLKWEQLGLNWDLSYNEWLQLFQKMEFTIKHVENPTTVESDGRNTWNATFRAIAPDKSFEMRLDFKRGNANGEGYSTSSKNSLYRMDVELLQLPSVLPSATATVSHKVSQGRFADFFPLYGVTLGKTTYADVEAMGYKVEENHVDIRGIRFYDHDEDKVFEDIFLYFLADRIPREWEQLGLNWDLSYNEWLQLFQKMEFTIKHVESPTIVESDGRKTLKAEFIATAPDKSFEMTLRFDSGSRYDRVEHNTSSKNSLHTITIHKR